jgi:hypothetical protein
MRKWKAMKAESKKAILDAFYQETNGFRNVAATSTFYPPIMEQYGLTLNELTAIEIKLNRLFN